VRLGAVVLAAGASLRLGRPKQLVLHEGESLLRRSTRLALSCADPVVVVLPPDPVPFLGELEGLDVLPKANPNAAEGPAASLRLGLRSLPPVDGALLLAVDQWALTAQDLTRLVADFAADPTRPAAARYAGTLGIPAILPRANFEEALTLRGDRGAKALLGGGHCRGPPRSGLRSGSARRPSAQAPRAAVFTAALRLALALRAFSTSGR
jgi:molybdenum cofactor cytidylyltransferase